MPGMLAGGVTRLCQRTQKWQLCESKEAIFDIYCSQASANTRLMATHNKNPKDEIQCCSKCHKYQLTSWFLPAKCTLHRDPTGCSCIRDIEKKSRQGDQGERCNPLISVISTRPAKRGFSSMQLYIATNKLLKLRHPAFYPICHHWRIQKEQNCFVMVHRLMEKKTLLLTQNLTRSTIESGDVHTFSSPGTDGISQIGHSWPSHITFADSLGNYLLQLPILLNRLQPLTSWYQVLSVDS